MPGLTLDAGPLIELDRDDARGRAYLRAATARGLEVVVPAAALAQSWRGARSARIGALLARVSVEAMDEVSARRVGELCGRTGTSDVVDASVVLCAMRRGHAVLTSDPDDLRRLSDRRLGPEIIDVRDLPGA